MALLLVHNFVHIFTLKSYFLIYFSFVLILWLSELGTEVIKAFFVPKIRAIGERIEPYLDGPGLGNADRIAATHIKQLIIVR